MTKWRIQNLILREIWEALDEKTLELYFSSELM